MPTPKINALRLASLESLLELEYQKLDVFRQELTITSNAATKFELKQRIAKEIIPSIQNHEHEYAQLISDEIQPTEIPESEANDLLQSVKDAVGQMNVAKNDGLSEKILSAIQEIKRKLDEPGKMASAKLKVVIPIIPTLISYELETDTESVLLRVWQKVKKLFKGKS